MTKEYHRVSVLRLTPRLYCNMQMNPFDLHRVESKLAEYEGLKQEIKSILSSADADLTSQKGISKDPAVIKEQQEALKVSVM